MAYETRAFKGVWIPNYIYLDDNLSWLEKFVIAEINSLDNERGCFASNDYFASFFKCGKKYISEVINGLVKKGYVTSEIEYEGKVVKSRILRIAIHLSDDFRLPPPTKKGDPLPQNRDTPLPQKQDYNNIALYNIDDIKHNVACNSKSKVITSYLKGSSVEDKGVRMVDADKAKLMFEKFRVMYRGTKRGLETEFTNFIKKTKDFDEVLENLAINYAAQIEAKDKARQNGQFVPQEKNLQTYINNRCWEEEFSSETKDVLYGNRNQRGFKSNTERLSDNYGKVVRGVLEKYGSE